MTLVWVTGNSGTGKSTLSGMLRAHGYVALDADEDGFSRWIDRAKGEVVVDPPYPVPEGWLDRYGWAIDRQRVETLVEESRSRIAFLCGSAAPVSPASADAVLTADALCYAEGAGSFVCWVTIAGGVAPYSSVWSGAPFSEVYTTGASGTCTPGRAYSVSVAVTDAAAARVSDPAYFICKGGPPI